MQYGIRKMLEIMPIEVQHRLSTKYGYTTPWPSSGILAIILLFRKVPECDGNDHRIRFHGWKFRPLLGKSEEERTVRMMKAEASFIAQLVKNGRVKVM